MTKPISPEAMTKFKMIPAELERRALAAYFRSGNTDQPSGGAHFEKVRGKAYVKLYNVRGLLAVYRVRNDGKLKGLRRWPAELERW